MARPHNPSTSRDTLQVPTVKVDNKPRDGSSSTSRTADRSRRKSESALPTSNESNRSSTSLHRADSVGNKKNAKVKERRLSGSTLAPETSERPNSRYPIYEGRLKQGTIRLLRIEPGSRSDLLVCSLAEEKLDSRPRYTALSYVWGDSKDESRIRCNKKNIYVTRNLENALCRLRYPDGTRMVWADAICINQDDIIERNEQVQLMQKIYDQASGVAVCLARNEMWEQDAQQAANLIDRIYKNLIWSNRQLVKGSAAYEDLDTLYSQASRTGAVPKLDDPLHCRLLNTFFGATWFSRVWCVQEISLSKTATVMFGANEQLPWAAVGSTAAWINAVRHHGNSLDRSLPRIPNAWGAYSMFLAKRYQSEHLFHALLDFQQCKSTDARDKIYGLLGLIADHADGSPVLKVDYKKSIKDVYIQAATRILEVTNDLSLLSASGYGSNLALRESIPSWVPVWSTNTSVAGIRAHEFWNACEMKHLKRWRVTSGKCLELRGFTVEPISGFSSIYRIDENESLKNMKPDWNRHFIDLWKKHNKRLGNDERGRKKFQEMFAYTLTMGLWQNASPVKDIEKAQFLADFHACMQLMTPRSVLKDYPLVVGTPSDTLKGEAGRYFAAMSPALSDRRIIHTSKGLLGIGPMWVLQSDVIAVLDGGSVPYVLRRLNDGTGEYLFIGTCYIHKIMNGAAALLKERNEGEIQSTRYVLR